MRTGHTLTRLPFNKAIQSALSSAVFAKDPGDQSNLRYWKLQVPTDRNRDGKNDSHDELAG